MNIIYKVYRFMYNLYIFIGIMVSLPILVILGVLFGMLSEYKWYNKGVCPKCGYKFELYYSNSQRGRKYICPNCRNSTWVSLNFIDKK